jgi:hypothetical protein
MDAFVAKPEVAEECASALVRGLGKSCYAFTL